jgi:hypothetical protein
MPMATDPPPAQGLSQVGRPSKPDISLNAEATPFDATAFDRLVIREPRSRREDARQTIAFVIVGCFGLVILFSFITFWTRGKTPVDDLLKLVQAIIAPVIGIVGAVTGFYFSSASDEKRDTKSGSPET